MSKATNAPTKLLSVSAESDATSDEALFWQQCRQGSLGALKIAIGLGIVVLTGGISLELMTGRINLSSLPLPSLLIACLLTMLAMLHRSTNSVAMMPKIVNFSAYLILAYMLANLLSQPVKQHYATTWASVLPIYLITYGQLIIPIGESLAFGLCSLLALPLSGWWLGLSVVELAPSIALLNLINAVGYFNRRHLEQQNRNLFNARRRAETAAEDKIRLLRQIGHNLRQPLQALGCHASVLETLFTDYPDANVRHFVGRMATTIDEVNSNCNRILDFANLELGRQQPVLSNVDINTVLAALETQFQVMALRRGLTLKVHIRRHPPYLVKSDASILTQILCNLLDNAVKFTRSGWIVVKAVKIGGSQLKLHIIDSGPGIDERQKPQIFDDDVHGHRRGNDQPVKGFGIGLSFVAKAVEQLPQHRLELYSKIGRGSDFKLYLPIAEQVQPRNTALVNGQAANLGLLVLLVDDDRSVIEALGQCLRQYGCRVETATSVAEFRVMLDDCLEQPNLLITDFYLDGGETAEDIIAILEAACGPIPALILSAMAIPDSVKAHLNDRVALLRKPAALPLLLETICKLVQRPIRTD